MIDENGYSPLNYDDALDTVQGFIRKENGEDTNVSSRSFWGTIARVLAQIAVNLDENCENVHDSGYIQQATGVNLDRIGGNYGLMRKQAEPASVTLSFTGTPGYVIPTGTVFMDENGNEFYSVDDCQLDVNGVGSTIVVSSELGSQYNVDAGTIVNQQSPVEEIDNVTNSQAAEGGQDMETDLDFRNRLLLASNSNESGTINGVYTALMNTQGVTAVKSVYNASISDNDSYGNPPKTVHYYVQGGTDQDVANTIFRVGGGGITLYGSLSKTVLDDSGSIQTIFFDRPQETPIYVKASIRVSDSFDQSEGTDDVKAAIEGYIESLKMGDTVVTNQFFSNIYAIDGIDYADVAIGTDKSTLSNDNIVLTAPILKFQRLMMTMWRLTMYQTSYDELYPQIFKMFDRGLAVGTGSNINTVIRVLSDFQLWLDNGAEMIQSSWIIDEAVGEQLDEIGDDIHQPRYGANDDTYRFILKTKILAAHSGGTINDIINIVCNALQIDPKSSGLKVHTDYHWDGTKMFGNPQVVDIDNLPTSLISSSQSLIILMDRLSSATLNGVTINTIAFMNNSKLIEYVGVGTQSIMVKEVNVKGGN